MQLSHTHPVRSAVFRDPNLVSSAGLVPILALARSAGLARLADQHLSVPTDKGANAGLKVSSLVAGMVAGADSIDDMALLRHGGMGKVFAGVYAPSTLGSFLRSFTFGHVRQLDAVAGRFLGGLAARTPVVAGIGEQVMVDIDDTIIEVHGYAKQGSGYGYSGVRGLNAILATLTTKDTAPVIVAQRLRQGSCGSPRGANAWSPTHWPRSRSCPPIWRFPQSTHILSTGPCPMTYLPASSPPVRSRTSAITDRPCLVSTWDTQVNANDRLNADADANRYRQFLGLR